MKNRHHRKPQSVGGISNLSNISVVNVNLHRAWHLLFVNYHPRDICEIINKTWIDPAWKFTCERR